LPLTCQYLVLPTGKAKSQEPIKDRVPRAWPLSPPLD